MVGQHTVLQLDGGSLAHKAYDRAIDDALAKLLDQVKAEAGLARAVGVNEPGKWLEAREHDRTPYGRVKDAVSLVQEGIEGITCATVLAGLEFDLASQKLPYAIPVNNYTR